jgi:hypothetical protein
MTIPDNPLKIPRLNRPLGQLLEAQVRLLTNLSASTVDSLSVQSFKVELQVLKDPFSTWA